MDSRTEKCSEYFFLDAYAAGIHPICRKPGDSEIFLGIAHFYHGIIDKAHAHYPAFCNASIGLLAPRTFQSETFEHRCSSSDCRKNSADYAFSSFGDAFDYLSQTYCQRGINRYGSNDLAYCQCFAFLYKLCVLPMLCFPI